MGYGFCEPNNPCDEVAVLLACPPQQLHLALKRAHPEHFVAPGWTDAEAGFFIRGSGHFSGGYDNPWPAIPCLRFIPPMLVRTIRTMTGETFELEGDNAKEKDAMLWFATLDTLAEQDEVEDGAYSAVLTKSLRSRRTKSRSTCIKIWIPRRAAQDPLRGGMGCAE